MSRETIQGISRNLQYFVYAVIIIALLFAVLGIPSSFTNLVINWLASLLVGSIAGAVTSLPAILLVEAFTGDRLKSILLLVEIRGFRFSISAFAIATFLVRYFIFR